MEVYLVLDVLIDVFRYESDMPGVLGIDGFLWWLEKERGYTIGFTRGHISKDDLEGWDVFIIISASGEVSFYDKEINDIASWVEKGGILFVGRPVKNFESVNRLLRVFGAEFLEEKAKSYAFFCGIPDRFLEADPRFKMIRDFIGEHKVNENLKAVAEVPGKDPKIAPYFIRVSEDWTVLGAAMMGNSPGAVAAIRNYGNGIVFAVGLLYMFYRWAYWWHNRELEKDDKSSLTNVKFLTQLFDFFEEHCSNLDI